MPTVSDRKALLRDLDNKIGVDVIVDLLVDSSGESSESSASESGSSEEDTELFEIQTAVASTRYLAPRHPVPKSHEFLNLLLSEYDEKRFREEARMSRSSFYRISNMIRDKDVFQSKSPFCQVCPEFQLLVASYRFGHYGNGASVGSVARKFGISEGATVQYTERVIAALCSLQETAIAWPSEEARTLIKKRIHKESGFPNCVGCVDGTHIVFYQKPCMSGEDYWNRKKQYSLHAMLVCNDRRRILYAFTGSAGSAHDSRVLGYSELGRSPAKFFTPDEYVLADSAYAATANILPCYKSPASNLLDNSQFNKYHAGARIWIEHTNGIFKGRMQSLKGLRIQILTARDHARAVYWFLACCVLHNLLQEHNEYIEDEWLNLVQEEEDGVHEETRTGHEKREIIKNYVLLERSQHAA